MFNDLVESVAVGKTTNKRWGFALSLAFQSACLVVLILLPLLYTAALPKAFMNTFLVALSAPPTTPPGAQKNVARENIGPSSRLPKDGVIREPHGFPPHAKIFSEPALPVDVEPDCDMMGSGLHFLDDEVKVQSLSLQSAPPAPVADNTPPQRIQKGGEIQAAQLISRLQPAYPVLARQSGIQGLVFLHAIIDKEGRVSELHVLSGHPLLVKAAIDAVNQWRYQPTLLNGQPVEVETTITVSFVLGG